MTVGNLGTAGNDELFGDTELNLAGLGAGNRMFALAGNDFVSGDARNVTATGRGGGDLVRAGDGIDTAYGDATGTLSGIGGDDSLYQDAGTGKLVGDAGDLAAGAQGGDDRLFGTGELFGDTDGAMSDEFSGGKATGGNDVLDARAETAPSFLSGDARDLLGTSAGGNDTLLGGAFGDTLLGDASTLTVAAGGGRDRLLGGAGGDTLLGDAEGMLLSAAGGRDILRGGPGDDVIYGDARFLADSADGGNDNLYGGGGNDTLWGDGDLQDAATDGSDRFHFQRDFGDDAVLDFRRGHDRLVLHDLEASEVEIAVVGGDTVLTTQADNSVTLVGFTGALTLGGIHPDVLFLG